MFSIVLLSWKTATLVRSERQGSPDSLSNAHIKKNLYPDAGRAETIDMGSPEKADLHASLTPTKVPGVQTSKGSGPQIQPSSGLGSPKQVFWSMGVAFCISRGSGCEKPTLVKEE